MSIGNKTTDLKKVTLIKWIGIRWLRIRSKALFLLVKLCSITKDNYTTITSVF